MAIALAMATMVVAAGAVVAAVSFDAETGKGFVGKGDVQLAFGWNNKALNTNASGVTFTGTSVTEQSWECQNPKNENIQDRERTTTTQGLVSHVERDNKKQITGFILNGYDGSESTVTEGNKLDSCPTNWALITPAGDPVPVEGAGGLFVNHDGKSVQLL